MEANAALRTIVRRDSGETYREMLERMAKESGIETPSADDLIRLDRARKGKKLPNEDWASGTDAEAKVAKMKDGTTHLAYKPEHDGGASALQLQPRGLFVAAASAGVCGAGGLHGGERAEHCRAGRRDDGRDCRTNHRCLRELRGRDEPARTSSRQSGSAGVCALRCMVISGPTRA
jgi:hypothetical protein